MANKCSSQETLLKRKRWQETIHVNCKCDRTPPAPQQIPLPTAFLFDYYFTKRKQMKKLPKMKRWQETYDTYKWDRTPPAPQQIPLPAGFFNH